MSRPGARALIDSVVDPDSFQCWDEPIDRTGGALALLPARRVIAAGNAWLAPLPPEGASAIVHGSSDFAPQMARRQRVRAVDLLADGTVHAVVPELAAAHEEPAAFARRIADECVHQIRLQGPAAR
jgi:acetyl-CoA carboxylase carboxyl transferase subunit beta